ncbi:hypothetical protein Q0O84_13435, partial [Staphylococcus aureus]|nr:hypothetical protein [Staphylococcus aureus]
ASRTFRRAFLLGYAHRIGERLSAARRQATAEAAREAASQRGVDLLPVLRSQQAAVEARTAELFPRVRSSRSRASVDAGGWYAGRA